MGDLSLFTGELLDAQQRQHVEALTGSVTPEQARWLSGYFAGLEAGIARQGGGGVAAPAAASSRTLTVLHGGETGNSAGIARSLVAAAGERGLNATLADMASYKSRQLKAEQDLVLVCATHGEGDPPQPGMNFFEYLESAKAAKLPDLRFAVLALGDSSYEHYCEAGKRLDRRFEELGATRLAPRVDCDVDYDEPAAAWSGELLALLAAEAKPAAVAVPAAAFAAPSLHDKRNPFQARVIENLSIVGRRSTKDIRHIELDIADSGLTYQPGDGIGIVTRNGPGPVEALLTATGLSGDAPLTVKGEAVSLAQALESHFEICTTVPRFLDHWAGLTGAAPLEELRQEERRAERQAYLRGHHIVDIVRNYPVPGIDAETFVAGLRPLQPRVYSLASSQAAFPDEAHITLSPLRYALHEEERHGVASAHLADRTEVGASLPVYIQGNDQFRLPADDAPVIMVGPGTGVAPFRAFLQEREARGAPGRNWLFFGERNSRSDFLYQVEWQEWLKDGLLTRMDVAFSRDGPEKTYVQHRMIERASELFGWLEDGAHFYVCGDAEQMAPDVHEALITVAAAAGGLSRDAADAYVRELQRSGRYHRDVY